MSLLFEQFDTLLTTPEAAVQFKAHIFTLAVQGKLVSQDPTDEPADRLLEKIKRDLAGSTEKQRKYTPKFEIDFPYKIPTTWVLTGLSEIGEVNPRNDADDEIIASFIPMRMVPDTYGERAEQEPRKWGEIRKGFTHFQENDVVVAKITPSFENGKSVVMRDLINGIGAGTTELHVFRGNPDLILPDYVWIFFKSSWFLAEGAFRMIGTAGQQRVPKEVIKDIPFPLPPLAEQKRIVAKVESLLAQTAAIKEHMIQAEKEKRKLNQSALYHLTNAENAAEFAERWGVIKDNFDLLYNHPENVAELKQTILQLAVQGKLLKQNPDNEPASELLEKIKAEKMQLINEGKLKKSKSLPKISKAEIPYDLPLGWEWVRLDELVEKIGSGSTPKGGRKVYTDSGTKFIRSQNVWNDGLRLEEVAHIPNEINERMIGSSVKPKDVLLNITGASIARSALVPDDFDIGNVNQHVTIIRLINLDLRFFVHLYMISPIVYNMIMDVQVGISREGLSMTRLRRFPIPIPPLQEQKRIINKVQGMINHCNELEAGLVSAREGHQRLVEAILGEAR